MLKLTKSSSTDDGSVPLPTQIQLDTGWDQSGDGNGAWGLGSASTVVFGLDDLEEQATPHDRRLTVECSPLVNRRREDNQTVTVFLNGQEVGSWELERGWQTYAMDLPEPALQVGPNSIRFVYRYNVTPAELGQGADTRELAVRFRRIAILNRSEVSDDGASSQVFYPGSTDDGSRIERSGRFFVPIKPPGSSRLTVSLDDDPHTFSFVDNSGAESSSISSLTIDGPGCVKLDVASHGSSLSRAELKLGLQPTAEVSLPSRPGSIERRPDVVLVILDAARADHFGAYGYARNTTPYIDAVAATGLVFQNAFATTPYTLSSMPTMLTGLGNSEHRVINHGDRLADEIPTLAQYLSASGYDTACYSGNGYNSRAQGLDKGCDVFEEFWRRGDHKAPGGIPHDPYPISDRAVQRIAQQDPDAPLFMMLHYVPPHEPYAPRPEFDIFGDPDYRGTVDGRTETIGAIDAGRLAASPADLQEIVSLYDGNLLNADDAVQRVVTALQSNGRWNDTVFLVVADHGEAFGEHGRMSHNSTLFDEMLHVPFILRVPEGLRPERVDTERLISLEDVTPTLLGLADAPPTAPLTGVDLLALPGDAPARGLTLRCPGPTVGYRTATHKAILHPGGDGELYDLRADPGERHNLVHTASDIYLCLVARLHADLAAEASSEASTAESSFDQEDLDALRSLGYVN